MRIRISEDFRVAYKRLKKRHKSLEYDFESLLASLLQNPMQGVELEGGARKVRLAITSKGRGKSGGARVISSASASWPTNCNSSTSMTKPISRMSVMLS